MSKIKKLLLSSLIFSSIIVASSSKSFADSIILNKDLTDGVNVRVKEDIDSDIIGGIEDYKIYEIKSESKDRFEIEFDGQKAYVGKDWFYKLNDTNLIEEANLKELEEDNSKNTGDKLKKNTKVTILEFLPESDLVKISYDENLKDNKNKNKLSTVEINPLLKPNEESKSSGNIEMPNTTALDEDNDSENDAPKEFYVKLSSLKISDKEDQELDKLKSYYEIINESIKKHIEMEKENESVEIEYIDNADYEIVSEMPSVIEVIDGTINIEDEDYISLPVYGTDIGIDMYERAVQFLGNPYVWGGIDPTNGIDCSGYTMQMYRSIGIDLPHFAQSQQRYGVEIPFGEEMAGDLVFFGTSLNNITHVGIADGYGNMIHASSPTTGIIVSPIYDPISIKRIVQ